MTREQLNDHDKYVVIDACIMVDAGDIVTLEYDDGSNVPKFKREKDGFAAYVDIERLSPIINEDYSLTY